ncbi:AMP-binding protein [Variovorax sp. dw_308]|uniref:AMP-binding protein n=1 Tax=Variovorax sp. dw_308 TaxID=2721546 RepID=UPI001C43FC6E|nr:AMP-binding protein [Variovorax sp. dw_308]
MIFRSPWPDIEIPAQSVTDFVFANEASHAQKIAFIDGPTGRTLTHGQVHGMARRVASALLKERGLRKGDVFCIFCPNLPEYVVAFHGVAMAGGVVTTASPLCTTETLAEQLGDSRARYLLTVPPFIGVALEAAKVAGVEEVFVFGEAEGATPFAALVAEEAGLLRIEIDPARDLVALPYSSGTTGRAKGVMLTHRNMVAMMAQLETLWGDATEDQSLAVLPFFHCYGLLAFVCMTVRRGLSCVTMPRFDFEQFLQLIERHRVTSLMLVPPIVLALAKHPLVAKYDLSSVQFINSGAAPLGEALQNEAGARMGVEVRQGYGMSESTLAVSGRRRDDDPAKPGAVGRLLPNNEARVIDVATGADLGPNQRGELLVRGPTVMRGYFGNVRATDATIDADGWLHTGDVVVIDDDGEFFIVDRLKELIKVNAHQVAPAQLESVLLTHPAVADAAVIGIPHEETGEAPKAFVVKRAEVSEAELVAHVAAHVEPYARVRAVAFVDAIPKSPSGKILRRELRERIVV